MVLPARIEIAYHLCAWIWMVSSHQVRKRAEGCFEPLPPGREAVLVCRNCSLLNWNIVWSGYIFWFGASFARSTSNFEMHKFGGIQICVYIQYWPSQWRRYLLNTDYNQFWRFLYKMKWWITLKVCFHGPWIFSWFYLFSFTPSGHITSRHWLV